MTSLEPLLHESRSRFFAFIRWWIAELSSMYVEWVHHHISGDPNRFDVTISEDALILHRYDRGVRLEERRIERARGLTGLLDSLNELMASSGKASAINIRLASDQVLKRRLALPAAARRNLGTTLELQLDRLTPFFSDDVLFDYLELSTRPSPAVISIELCVVPRKTVEVLLNAVDPDRQCRIWISAASDSPSAFYQFLDQKPALKTAASQWERRLVYALAGLCLLLGSTMALRDHAIQHEIDRKIAALRPQAKQAETVRESMEQKVARVQWLGDTLSAPDAADVLVELTRTIPDDGWLFQFQQDGASVQIGGATKDASQLVSLLSKSSRLQSVSLRSATQMPGDTRERFDISMMVERSQ